MPLTMKNAIFTSNPVVGVIARLKQFHWITGVFHHGSACRGCSKHQRNVTIGRRLSNCRETGDRAQNRGPMVDYSDCRSCNTRGVFPAPSSFHRAATKPRTSHASVRGALENCAQEADTFQRREQRKSRPPEGRHISLPGEVTSNGDCL